MGRIARRTFLRTTAAGLAGATIASIRPPKVYGKGSKEVVFVGFGGSFMDAARKAWFEPFERETGIRVRVASPNLGKLATMVETGRVEWDVVDVGGSQLGLVTSKNLAQPLDYTIIDPDGLPRQGYGEFAISYTLFATLLGWSTRRYRDPDVPASWRDFWDVQRFPGPRSLWKVPYNTLEYALMADGVAPDALYPLDVDRAFRKLDAIKPHIKVWWTSGQQPIQLFAGGEVDMACAFGARLALAKRGGVELDYTFNQGTLASTWVFVPVGAPNRENAMRLIAYIVSPRVNAQITEFSPSRPANAKAYQYVKPELVTRTVAAPRNTASLWDWRSVRKMARLDELGWWAKSYAAVDRRFQEWVAK